MKMKKIYHIIFAMAVLPYFGSCSFLDVEPHVIAEETFYDSKEDAQLALNGVYGVINSYQLYGCHLVIDLNYNDDLGHYMSTTGEFKGASMELDANSAGVYYVWTWLYKGIKNANAFMERIVQTDYDPDGEMYAQARFLRAHFYFLLAQNFRDVPLRETSTATYEDVKCPATSQFEVMTWAVNEMEASLENVTESLDHSPSDINKSIVHGILARDYLYMAGATVTGGDKKSYYVKARDHCKAVMDDGKHRLNPDYTQIFINMIADKYDREYYESMWEADFLGDRTSSSYWGNSRWGELNGIRSSNTGTDFSIINTNYAYGLFCNTLRLWDLYMTTDRVMLERTLSVVTDKRQDWNIPPYHYNGYSESANRLYPYGGDPSDVRILIPGVDKVPWCTGTIKKGRDTNSDPTCYKTGRYIGKFRRECIYEGRHEFKAIWNGINVPILRYTDVIMMYAEAVNEIEGGPNQEIYEIIKSVRDRAGIQTEPFSTYATHDKFLQFIQNERGREFCFEGYRKFDLLRWGIYLSTMQEVAQMAASDSRWEAGKTAYTLIVSRMSKKNEYMPIPSLELAVNTELRQNPLW